MPAKNKTTPGGAKKKTSAGKKKTNTGKVNCPYCGTVHEIPLDTDVLECTHCGYEITMGKKVLPLSNNPLAP